MIQGFCGHHVVSERRISADLDTRTCGDFVTINIFWTLQIQASNNWKTNEIKIIQGTFEKTQRNKIEINLTMTQILLHTYLHIFDWDILFYRIQKFKWTSWNRKSLYRSNIILCSRKWTPRIRILWHNYLIQEIYEEIWGFL